MARSPRASRRDTLETPSTDYAPPDPAPSDTPEGQRALAAQDRQQAADSANASEQDEENAETVTRLEDGGAIIDLDPHRKRRARKPKDHFANLLVGADPALLGRIVSLGHDLIDDIEIDIEAATKSVEKYATALGATGMTDKAPGGASFPGASTVTHPILGEVCADYSSRVIREMLPPKGPAKPHVEGTVTKEKYERAQRVARFINYQTRKVMRNFASEVEQTFTQQPFEGAGYMKLWLEGKKPHIAFVPSNKVHRPNNEDDFYSCERITHELNISERKLKTKMRRGVYIQHEFGDSTEPEADKVDQVADKVTGIKQPAENVDNTRTLYETSCFSDIEDDDGTDKPYVVTVDKETKTVLAVYRNWAEDDEDCERLDTLYEFGFMPFMKGKPVGLATMLSGLPKAITGALRASLDSALARNFPGAYKLKGGQSGSNTSPGPGQVAELENATGIDDIRKQLIPTTPGSPDPTLNVLLGTLVDTARGMVRTTFDDIIGKGRQDIPVGTLMMLIDEGTVVYSSIFTRQHRSMSRLLAGLYRLNQQVVENVKFSDSDGDDAVTAHDFEGDSVVVPTSDPRINSDTQRWTRANFVAGRAAGQLTAPLYNQYEVEKGLLETAQVENIDVLLNKPQTPTELSAPNENVAVVLGRPIVAFPEQNHLAHLESHADFVKSPMFGAAKAMIPKIIPAMVNHFQEHMALEYAAETLRMVDTALNLVLKEKGNEQYKALFEGAESDKEKLSVVEMMKVKDPELGRRVDKLFAAVSAPVLAKMAELFKNILPMLDQMAQTAQQFAPPKPMDPTQAALQAATLTTGAQKEVAQIREQGAAAREQTRLQAEQVSEQGKAERESQELAQKQALGMAQLAQQDEAARASVAQRATDMDTRHTMNIEDNKTALVISAAEIADGGNSSVSTGTGINP